MYKVLIVDDEDIIVKGLTHTMPWADYNCQVVATANDGTEAQSLIEKFKPDILFTDICMPNQDGLALVAAVKSENPNMQITILSGYSEFEYAQKAISLGITRYILKPSKFAQLEEALAQMIQNLKALPDSNFSEKEEPEVETEPAQNFIIANAISYMEQHYTQKLTLSEVATQVYVSQWHLSKLISKYKNQSFSDILNGIRIQKAKELLTDPALKIWEISDAIGFADVTHFSRIFKKMEGISANEYRNNKQKVSI